MKRHALAAPCLSALAVLLVSLLAVSTAWAQSYPRMIMGITESPLTFHPWDMGESNSPDHRQFYDRLIRLNKKLEPELELATGYSYSEDGKVFRVTLRKGARFHNGKELTSADVRKSWEQVARGKFTGSHANSRPLALLIQEVRTPDPYTVEFIYENPNPAVFDFMDLFYIADMDDWGQENQRPMGSGPFKLATFVTGERLVMVPNEDYWGDKPQVELEYRVIPDPQALVLNLQSGSVDSIIFFPIREVPRLQDQGFNVYAANADGIVLDVLYGHDFPPFKDRRVRQAINHMINRNRFHRVIMSGIGEPRCLPWSREHWLYDAELEAQYCAFDPEIAKQKLAAAGYADGFDVNLLVNSQRSEHVKIAEMMQNDLRRIGINVRLDAKDTAGYTSVYRANELDFAIHNYGRGNKDPASLFGTATVWKDPGNVQQVSDPRYRELIRWGASTLDPDERKQIYRVLNIHLLEDPMTSAVHTLPRMFAYNKKLQNVSASVDGFMYFQHLTIAN